MKQIVSYKDMEVWRRSMDLVTDVYALTRTFPDDERFGLTSQMRRCAVSIPSNIAEGFLRTGRRDYARFIGISFSSAGELETQIEIARRLRYIEWDEAQKINLKLGVILKMLNRLRATLITKH